MQRKTKSIDKSLAYLFMQSGNPLLLSPTHGNSLLQFYCTLLLNYIITPNKKKGTTDISSNYSKSCGAVNFYLTIQIKNEIWH